MDSESIKVPSYNYVKLAEALKLLLIIGAVDTEMHIFDDVGVAAVD